MSAPGLAFEAACPIDGGALTIVTQAEPTVHRASAICRCTTCNAELHIVVGLDVIHDPRWRAPNARSKSGK